MITFQYYSDLHLEFHPNEYPTIIRSNQAGVCILAGDIGSLSSDQYWIFLKKLNDTFDYTIVILGNHEFYGSSITDTLQCIKEKKQDLHKVFFMNNDILQINDCFIIGSTLWSNIPDHAKEEVNYRMNDYRYIKDFTIDVHNQLHKESVHYIKEKLDYIDANYPTHKKIVVTHHAPIINGTSPRIYTNMLTNHTFATDLHDLVDRSTIWIYGHTHFNTTQAHPKLRTNQLGYNWNVPCTGFDSNASFHV